MKQKTYLDIDMYPPFEGFPKEGITFLKNLKKNNNREWFGKHKPEFEEYVKLPMQSFIEAMKQPMATLAPEFQVDPKKSLFRIYRDIRFSKNKAPYKTHVSAIFHLKGHWEQSAGYYVHVEPGEVFLGGGVYMPDGNQLKNIRTAIAGQSEEFLAIVQNKTFKKDLESSREKNYSESVGIFSRSSDGRMVKIQTVLRVCFMERKRMLFAEIFTKKFSGYIKICCRS